MALARVFSTYATPITYGFFNPIFPSCAGTNNSSDMQPQNLFESAEAKIGVSCVGGGMLLVASLFFYQRCRQKKANTITLKVIIKRSSVASLGESYVIPTFNLKRKFTDNDRLRMENEGMIGFLVSEISQILQDKIDNKENLNLDLPVEQVIGVFLGNEAASGKVDKHDIPLVFTLDLMPTNRRCQFFSFVMPPLIKTTIFFELAFGSIQNIGSLMLTNGILPFNRDANNILAIAQSVFSSSFVFILSLYSPVQAFMPDLGAALDEAFEKKFFCRNRQAQAEQKPPRDWKIYGLKAALILLLVNSLYTGAVGDYQTTMSLKDKLLTSNELLPPWLIYVSSLIAFSANQFNDPITLFTAVFMAFKLLDIYSFRKHQKRVANTIEINNELVINIPNTSELGFFSPREQRFDTPLLLEEENKTEEPHTVPQNP